MFGWWDCNLCGREFVSKASRDRIGHDFEERLEEHKREVERRDEYLAGADADLKARDQAIQRLETDLCLEREKVAQLEAKVSELTAELANARESLKRTQAAMWSMIDGGITREAAELVDRLVAAERERAAKTVEAINAAINGPEQDALQWYARSALQRAAEAIRRGDDGKCLKTNCAAQAIPGKGWCEDCARRTFEQARDESEIQARRDLEANAEKFRRGE